MQITLSSEGLWSMLQSLPTDTKRWLGEKLIEASKEEEAEARLVPYTLEELNARIDEFEAELEAGEAGYTLEEFDARTRREPHAQAGKTELKP